MKEKKNTMDPVWSAVDEARKEKASLAMDLSKLIQQREEIENQYDAAADSGDVETMQVLRKEREAVEDMILVTKKKLSRPPNKIDVLSSFRAYAEEHNKVLRDKYAKYCEARDALFQQYLELLKMQDEALQNQEKCDVYLDEKGARRLPGVILHAELQILEYIPKAGTSVDYRGCQFEPETACFAALGYLKNEMIGKANQVHHYHNQGRFQEESAHQSALAATII